MCKKSYTVNQPGIISQLHYPYHSWHIQSPNHSTRFAFHNSTQFCILPELGLFKPSVRRLLLTAHHAPQGRPCARLAPACSVLYNAYHKYMDKCSYLSRSTLRVLESKLAVYLAFISVHTSGFGNQNLQFI